MIRRKEIDNSLEEKILTGLIVSERFCRDIQSSFKSEYFQIPYAQKISRWAMDYYGKYRKPIEAHIEDIFSEEKQKLKEEEADLIATFLSKLSNQYEQETNFNSDYLYDKTTSYFDERSLKILSEKIDALTSLGKAYEAKKEIQKYREVTKQISGWVDPFSETTVKKYFKDTMNNVNQLFQLPGHLGELIGPFERNWLFGILAPMKRGKSFWIQEISIQALMEKCRVALFSLEMDIFRMERRIYRRITATADNGGSFIYPCFDCKKNQLDTCNKAIRKNHSKLIKDDGTKPKFDERPSYTVCTECRGTKDFELETWFTTYQREKMKLRSTVSTAKGLKEMYGDNLRIKSYPAFSANLSRIKYDLDELEYTQDFIPDVICIDYADILAPEDSRVTGRERLDETWKTLKNIADSRHCLVVTASQSNRGSIDKQFVTQKDIAEDIRKLAHVDGMMSLNQLPEEKTNGIIRVSVIAERDDDFDQYKTCTVLQNLKLGQTFLDSELGAVIKEKKEKKE